MLLVLLPYGVLLLLLLLRLQEVEIVLTAHPTQVNRATVMNKYINLATLL